MPHHAEVRSGLKLAPADGFSLLEALIAATVFVVAVVSLVQLVTHAAEQSLRTELATVSLTLAQSKLEALRAARFEFDASGLRSEAGSLALSPADAHMRDAPAYAETLDRFGESLPATASGAYLRRWSVASLDDDLDTRLLIVCVTVTGTRASAVREGCVWSIRTRQP